MEILRSPEVSLASKLVSEHALRRVGEGAVSFAEVLRNEASEEALEVEGVVHAVLQLEPGLVEKAVALEEIVSLLVEAAVAAAGLRPSNGFSSGFIDQVRSESSPPLVVVSNVDLCRPSWVFVFNGA